MKVKDARLITGHKTGLGRTTKMPGYSTALAARDCVTGVQLNKKEGTICSRCYALRGNYVFPDVKGSHERRLEALGSAEWVVNMAFLINRRCIATDYELSYFRWFDSGDIQNLDHLIKIMAVVRKTPEVKHWLATRELLTLFKYDRLVKHGLQEHPPGNVVVRVSSTMFGQAPLTSVPSWANTSTVHWGDAAKTCPARTQNNSCGDCRSCWDSTCSNINYPRH